MGRQAKNCFVCGTSCTDDHMSITPTMVNGTLRPSYKALAICSEQCLRDWANSTVWHADDDPRVASLLPGVE